MEYLMIFIFEFQLKELVSNGKQALTQKLDAKKNVAIFVRKLEKHFIRTWQSFEKLPLNFFASLCLAKIELKQNGMNSLYETTCQTHLPYAKTINFILFVMKSKRKASKTRNDTRA